MEIRRVIKFCDIYPEHIYYLPDVSPLIKGLKRESLEVKDGAYGAGK